MKQKKRLSPGYSREDYLEALLESIDENIKDEGSGSDCLNRLVEAIIKGGWPEDRVQDLIASSQNPYEGDFVDRLYQIHSLKHQESKVPMIKSEEIARPGGSCEVEVAPVADITEMKQPEVEAPAMTPEEIIYKRTLAELRRESSKPTPRKKQFYEPFR